MSQYSFDKEIRSLMKVLISLATHFGWDKEELTILLIQEYNKQNGL